MSGFDISKFTGAAVEHASFRYEKNLNQLQNNGFSTSEIEQAVEGAIDNIAREATRSFVIYGEPQSGKTNMMIALTARLLDDGHRIIIVLLNDSVQLLEQNKERFSASGLDPSPKIYTEILDPSHDLTNGCWVIFSKKNSGDLTKLIDRVGDLNAKVIIDDEADYASPNGKVNKNEKTKINSLIERLIGHDGIYIGVTATPARLDLNNTFENNNERWIDFPPHQFYTGQDRFFPMQFKGIENLPYKLVTLPEDHDDPKFLREALLSFMVNVAYLNLEVNGVDNENNYSILIHTSGKKVDHTDDYKQVVKTLSILSDEEHPRFASYLEAIWKIAAERYPGHEDTITKYIKINIGRVNIVVMNSDSDKKNVGAYKSATSPSSLFTIAIGGNIVSRGVTFDNLLSMFFTRDVKHKIQQDTYIQRARMFGTRGKYLSYFELHIPTNLYLNWQRCFVFHKLSLAAIKSGQGSPVWLEDNKVSAAASSSIDKSSVSLDSGEMSWQLFDYTENLDAIIQKYNTPELNKLRAISEVVGEESLPEYLISFIQGFMPYGDESVAIHPSSTLESYSSADIENIQRTKGFMATNTLEKDKYPRAIHHIKIFKNPNGKARVFYKYTPEAGNIRFLRNRRSK